MIVVAGKLDTAVEGTLGVADSVVVLHCHKLGLRKFLALGGTISLMSCPATVYVLG
jgi:hypothetical protein